MSEVFCLNKMQMHTLLSLADASVSSVKNLLLVVRDVTGVYPWVWDGAQFCMSAGLMS